MDFWLRQNMDGYHHYCIPHSSVVKREWCWWPPINEHLNLEHWSTVYTKIPHLQEFPEDVLIQLTWAPDHQKWGSSKSARWEGAFKFLGNRQWNYLGLLPKSKIGKTSFPKSKFQPPFEFDVSRWLEIMVVQMSINHCPFYPSKCESWKISSSSFCRLGEDMGTIPRRSSARENSKRGTRFCLKVLSSPGRLAKKKQQPTNEKPSWRKCL